MPDIPDEAWREARKQARIHGYVEGINGLSFAEGWRLALASVRPEAEVRAEVAAQIRSMIAPGVRPPADLMPLVGRPSTTAFAEWAARIAESSPTDPKGTA